MANDFSVEILVDGTRNTVLKAVGVLDSGNMAQRIVVDLADQYIDPIGDLVGMYRIDILEFSVEDPLAVLLWWGGVPTRIMCMAGRGIMNLGEVYGGISNTEAINVRNGKILATTVGYTSGTLSFTFTLSLSKQVSNATPSAPSLILMEDGVSFILLENGTDLIAME